MSLNLLLVAGWAVLLAVFLAIRPSLHSPLAWLLLIPSCALGGAYMIRTAHEGRKARQDWRKWRQRLSTLVDKPDIEDDGHLFEQFARDEWERILAELERAPKGSRSLRKAIQVVDPEFEKER